MKRCYQIILCALIGMQSYASAEIQQITVRWTSLLCTDACVEILYRELKEIHGVGQITIDQGAGQAVLKWQPKIPFEFTSLNTAMHMVGLSMRDIRIRVRGTILPTSSSIYIVSEGDGTRFELMNPIVPNSEGQTHEFNYSARMLSPALKQKLMDGYNKRQVATIEGPVFMPERMTVPTQIVVDHLTFAEPAAKK